MKNVRIPQWLEGLPLAPEFRPTDTEFADPIAYINKIEKDASAFGICKVIPPLPKPSRKYVFHNVNKSLSKCPELGSKRGESDSDAGTSIGGEMKAVFTTRQQELGSEKGKKLKGAVGDRFYGARKQVWQSGEVYTLEKFEAKSKCFAKSQLGMVKEVSPFVIESMFWKAASEKPIYVEYANDVPGSGFGEPEGSQRYFYRRRKKRKRSSFDRNSIENSDSQNNQVDTLNKVRDSTNSGNQDNLNSCIETEADPICSGQSHYATSFSGQKEFQGSTEVEGTAGWRLSNSPWNLQVISRSAGSLTRFMPDDIPGVTSPMVYIGMLFSWFAWHVEDHELHSLNYLHIGAPKTWYAVPGCYARKFEEAIRLNAYEGNPDRLVALSLLGEKTTVLSPEIILSCGIPCCRLVQNPGEFVVTFPRAYHIGFSHGFNCGEAANFGTPQWLTVAKEAAVRRAAMNYLPMLSHQQLLYLLTMSFISRIPRSLLPGVRSSRFRDRQKEERELLVKRIFVEDILQENILLRILLQRNHLYHLVLWDAESLPSSKESKLCKDMDSGSMVKDCLPNNDHMHDLSELNDYINAVGFDLNSDDMAYDFQVESGALPCVACGVLGFPFMAVLQPSEIASHSLLLPDPHAVSVGDSCIRGEASLVPGTSRFIHTVSEQTPVLRHEDVSSKCEATNGWNISNAFLKPRIFCLEHAIEVEGLLSSNGGANVLVICHSDFEKIKNHVADVAEEVHTPFRFTEMPLGNASSENFNLIDIAIGTEEHDCAEDWTSKLSINLQHHMKFKSDRYENSQHLLSLRWLFSDETPISKASSVVWQSRKFRTKRQHRSQLGSKSSDGGEVVEDMKANEKHPKDNNDLKIIQYSRKKFKGRVSTVNQVTVDAK